MDAQAMIAFGDERGLVTIMVAVSAWLAIGVLIGAFHYLALRKNVQMLANGGSLSKAMAMRLIRFAAMAGALAVIARHYGALSLLIATLGLVASRTAVLRLGAQR
jgi:hypothetical protein